MTMKEGTLATKCDHKNPDWLSDDQGYTFPELSHDDITLSVRKDPSGEVAVNIGIGKRKVLIRVPHKDIPTSKDPQRPHTLAVARGLRPL